MSTDDARVNGLTTNGRLRVGINNQNFLLVLAGSPDGDPRGIAPDLGRELARRLGVPVEFVRFNGAGALFDAVKAGVCDVGFLAAEPQRAAELVFSPPYLEIPVTFLVPTGSPIGSIAEVDRDGVRVAVAERSAYDLFLTRTLKKAQIVRAPDIAASYDAFVEQRLEALAGLQPKLVEEAERLPGSRILDGQVTGVQQAIGAPRRDEAATCLREFVEDIKRSDFVVRAIERHGVRGVRAAP